MSSAREGGGADGSRIVNSLCGMCATHCPIQVEVREGRAVWLQGNPNDRTMGTSLCARGAAGLTLEDDDERPRQPMIRVGARGAGQWRPVGWDEALDYVAGKLAEAIGRHGSRTVALSDRGGHFADLTRRFLRALGSPNYFDHDSSCASNAHHAARSLFGLGRAGLSYDIKETRHIVLYGRNLVESLMVKEVKDFIGALGKGARCTYIDPRVSLTACKATRYWQIRPATDYALNLAIIHEVLADGLYDRKFVARWVSGMDYLAEAVRGCTPEWQEAHTGIPAAELRAFVREIAEDAPNVIFHGGWMTARHRQSFYVSRTAYILNVLMGAIEVPGGVVLAKGPADLGRKGLNRLTAGMPEVREERVDGAGRRLPHIDPAAGLLHRLFAAMECGAPYPITAYVAYRHDPLTGAPDPEAVKRALDRLDLLVAIDVNYSETAWYSDVILPETTYLERGGIIATLPGPKPAFAIRDQALAPRFDTRPAWWIFREVLRRLGLGGRFDFDGIEDIWRHQLEGTGVTLDDLRAKGVVPLAERPVLFDREDGLRFPTPSGTIEMRSAVLDKAGLPSLAPFAAPAELDEGEFRLLFGRTAVHTHGQTMNNPLLHDMRPDNPVWMHPDRAAALGIADGDAVEISRGGTAVVTTVEVTPLIHPEAVFLFHGYGRTVPAQTRACGRGVADQRLQTGMLHTFDPAGGGSAMTETIVRVRRIEVPE
ncbi:MAG: molybdopterin-dependent oxidoreductase [Magnetospirillum sp.]|nr:molybdopterin-dependent oxidoreductase [Magnetospirillum sp.]